MPTDPSGSPDRSVLSLAPAEVTWDSHTGRFRRRVVVESRRFDDLLVDGVSLRALVPNADQDAGVLVTDRPGAAIRAVNELLGREDSDAGAGRVRLLTCPVCGDISCGSLTAALVIGTNSVTWAAIGWQTDDGMLDEPVAVRPITFDRAAYDGTLVNALSRYRSMLDG